jgi:hypothetical protein
VYVWSVTGWSLLQTLSDATNIIYTLDFSNDSNWLAAGSADNNVRIYRASDWSLNKVITNATEAINSVRFSDDNNWLAAGGLDNYVRVYYANCPPIIITNASTGIEETNVTLKGYLSSDGGSTTTCGFRYGTSTGSYSENFTKGTYSSDTEFENNNGSLTQGQIYYFQAWANNSKGFANGSELTVLTKPDNATNIAVTSLDDGFNITWTDPVSGNYNATVLRFKTTGYPISETDGTELYNGTNTYYEHTSLISGTTYYYRVWGYANWTYDSTTLYQYSNNNESISQIYVSAPIVTTNASTNLEEQNATLNGYLENDGGIPCIVWFDYGTTNSYGNRIYKNGNFSHSIVNDEGDGVVDETTICVGSSNNGNPNDGSAEYHPDTDFTIEEVSVNFNPEGSPYSLLVDVYIDNGICDTDYTDGTKVKSNWEPIWSSGWQSFTLDTPYNVTAGQTYEISFVSQNVVGSGNGLRIYYDSSAPGTYYRWRHNSEWSENYYADIILSGIYHPLIPSGYEFNVSVSGLNVGELYYYCAGANNSQGFSNGSELTFLTKPDNATNIAVTSIDGGFNITWTGPVSGNYNATVLRFKTTGYPISETDGTELYNGTNTYYEHTSLISGTTYYYRVWGYANWTYDSTTLYQYSNSNESISQIYVSAPIVTTNASTGIEETNVTLKGYLNSDGGSMTTCGFRYGTSTGSYSENFTKGTYTSDTEFENNNGSLTQGQIYYFQAWANNSKGFASSSELTVLTKPNSPSSLTSQANSTSIIYLTWTNGSGANITYIERNTLGSWSRGQGTTIYNGSGTSYEDSGLQAGSTYYYRAWSFANWTYDSTEIYQWSDNNSYTSKKTSSDGGGGGSPPSSPPIPSLPSPSDEEEESITVKEQIEKLYNITLNENFSATDSDGDGLVDTFSDPNGILQSKRVVTIDGSATFLLSVNNELNNLFLWNPSADSITSVNYTAGEISSTERDVRDNRIIITTTVEKSGWIYLKISDRYLDKSDLTVQTEEGRNISLERIWRENGDIYVLDDPSTTYLFIYRPIGYLFDVVLELTADSVYAGDSFVAIITQINVGEPGLVNGTLIYTLSNENKIIWSETENVSVLGQRTSNKTITTSGFSPGTYTYTVSYNYTGGQTASAQASFIVKSKSTPGIIPIWILIVVFAIIILISLIALILFKKGHLSIGKNNEKRWRY